MQVVAADASPRQMTTTTTRLESGTLLVGGRELLARSPPEVTLRAGVADAAPGAAFLGTRAAVPSSRHVFPLGTIAKGWRWLSLFRFKIWWMAPKTGSDAAGVPAETQMLLLETKNGAEDAVYALMLPVLEGKFRASLQGAPEEELQFCFESGDPDVQTVEAVDAVFVNSGDNPFKLIKESIKILSKIKGTFSHIENKETPPQS
uniref:Uncharacterized protein n=2 Tax=Avena sativa TaxID=4498 RepID=A0ACD5V596_AVESA